MIIGIDGNEANIKERVGVNSYAYELLWELYKLREEGFTNHRFIVFLKKKPLFDLPKPKKWFEYVVLKGEKLWVLTKLSPLLIFTKKRPDVFFSPSHYLPLFVRIPRVCSIMDLGYLNFSEHFKKLTFWQLKYWTAISLIISKRIIAISNSTKNDIVRHYPYTSSKIQVTHLGYDKRRFNNNINSADVRRVRKKYRIDGEYLLMLGTLKPSKNIIGTIYAFKQVISRFNRVKLVIAGKKGWLFNDIYKAVTALNLEKYVIFTDFVDEDDKPALIFAAKALISPSFWEGFGLNVLESMACSTPVIISSKGSLPEIAGKVGIRVDPNDSKSIASGVMGILAMPEKRYNKLIEDGLRRAGRFSWEITARKTLQILEEAV